MASNRTTTNYARLCQLLIGIGTEVLRDKFDAICPPANLHSVLQNAKDQLQDLRSKGVLSVLQLNKLYPAIAKKVSSKNFDISILCVLMTNICSLRKPKKGWKNPPDRRDFCAAAEVMRIRELRNSIYAHATEASVDDAKFNTYWNDIRNVLVRFGGASYEEDIATLETESMDPENEKHYIGLLEQWKKDEKNIKEKLNTIVDVVQDNNAKLCEIANQFAARGLLPISIDLGDVVLRNTPNDDRLEKEQRRKQLMSALCRKFFKEEAGNRPSESIPDCLKCYLQGALDAEVTDESEGSLKITVLCRTLEILERLWEDYSSGHLNEVAENCLITDEIRMRYDVESLTLKTTILEADYLACQHSLISQEIPCSTRGEESALQIKAQGAQKTDIQAETRTTDSETAVTALGRSCELGDCKEHTEASSQSMLEGNVEMKCKELLPSVAVNFPVSGSPQYGQHHPKLFHLSTPGEELDGRIRIAVKCNDLKSLESLWEGYRSGHLNTAVEKYLLTDDIKEKFGVESLNVETTILEDAYQTCKEYISAGVEENPLVQMATPSATSTREKTNYARICRLLLDFGALALRDKFDRLHTPSNLSSVLAKNTKKLCKVTNPSQKKILNLTIPPGSTPAPTVSSMDFDITLLTVLLRKICDLNPPTSTSNWDEPPSPSDMSHEAVIVRIKSFRNEVFAHAAKASVDDATFNTIWTDIQDAIVRLGGNKTEMDALKTECMDPVVEQEFIDQVRKMTKDEEDIREKIESLGKMTEDKIDEMRKEVHEEMGEVKESLEELHEKLDAGRERGSKLESELPKVPADIHGHTLEVDRIVKILTDGSLKDIAGVLVSGIPGIGKSTVSIQAGHKLRDDFGRIVKFCSLRDMQSAQNGCNTKDDKGEKVSREILSTCQPSQQAAQEYPEHVLLNWCRGLGQDLVIVLDNAEDAMEDSFNDSFIHLLTKMRTCSKEKIKFIITSRRTDIRSTDPVPFNVEKVPIESLSEEDSIQVLKGDGRFQMDSNVSAEKLRRVAELCEYIPLALRLASPLLSSDSEYSVDELIVDLEKHPTRTLEREAVMEIAFEKLSEPLRHSLIGLSVFSRSFEKEAAKALLGGNCARHLTMLTKRCFIQKHGDRYLLHLLIRSYARTIGAERSPDVLNHSQRAFHEHFLAMISENAEMYMRKDKCKASFDLFNEERLNYESLLTDVSDGKIQNCDRLRDALNGCRKIAHYVEFCVPVKLYEDFLNGLYRYSQEQNEIVHQVEILCLLHYEKRKQGRAEKNPKGLMDKASKLFDENRPAFKKSIPSEVFYRYHYGRYLSQDCDQTIEAQEYFEEALSICESYERETFSEKGPILEQMGHFANSQGRKDEASKCYLQALNFRQAHYGDHILTAFSHEIVAKYYLDHRNLPEAEKNYKKAIDIMKRLNRAEHRESVSLYRRMGICLQKRQMFHESREMYEKGSEVADNTIDGDHKWKVWVKTRLACLLHSKYPDDAATAFGIAKDTLEMGRRLGLKDKEWAQKQELEKICQIHLGELLF